MIIQSAARKSLFSIRPLAANWTNSYASGKQKINLKKAASRQWLLRQMNDKFVKLAKVDNWRCRSAYKLLEINDRYGILQPGMRVLDCGAAPGSWSQVAARLVNSTGGDPELGTGFVVSLDRDFFRPVEGCLCIRNADITSDRTKLQIAKVLGDDKVDVLLSDMAPNASGHKEMDHENIVQLNLQLVDFAKTVLRDGGSLVCKLWEGGRTRHFNNILSTVFADVKVVKPEASRTNSAEIFFLARGYENPKRACSVNVSKPTNE